MTFKELREASGMTQKAFSEYFAIPYRTVQDWNAGVRKCPEYILSLMAYKLKKEGFVPFGYNIDGTICTEEAEVVKRHIERLIEENAKPTVAYAGKMKNDIPSTTCEQIIDTEMFEKARLALLESNPALVESMERDIQKSHEARMKAVHATSYLGNATPEELSNRVKEFGKHRKSKKAGE